MTSEKKRKDGNKINIVLEAIETPRGVVPTVQSIESLIVGINDLLEKIVSLFEKIMESISELKNQTSRLDDRVRKLEIALKLIQDQIAEIKAVESLTSTKSAIVASKEDNEKDLRKKLLSILQGD